MAEIEVKVLGVDPGELRRKLFELGAERVKKGREVNQMFDFSDGRLFARGGYVRVRSFSGRCTLTIKERIGSGPFRESREHETEVSDPGETRLFLEALGLGLRRVDEKDRESYRLGDILYEIDEWPGYPPYLEVEAPTREAVEAGLAKLGYHLSDSTSKHFHELASEVYGKPLPPNLKFED
ncbi:MAG: class IV adenylate cyclase [Candidatus Wallbacteria bacterium]|nr:class IV adenylate cyclase [Candidatus Wallbacteria bacterium]